MIETSTHEYVRKSDDLDSLIAYQRCWGWQFVSYSPGSHNDLLRVTFQRDTSMKNYEQICLIESQNILHNRLFHPNFAAWWVLNQNHLKWEWDFISLLFKIGLGCLVFLLLMYFSDMTAFIVSCVVVFIFYFFMIFRIIQQRKFIDQQYDKLIPSPAKFKTPKELEAEKDLALRLQQE